MQFQDDQTFETQSTISFVASRFENSEVITCEANNPVLEAHNEEPERASVTVEVKCEYHDLFVAHFTEAGLAVAGLSCTGLSKKISAGLENCTLHVFGRNRNSCSLRELLFLNHDTINVIDEKWDCRLRVHCPV